MFPRRQFFKSDVTGQNVKDYAEPYLGIPIILAKLCTGATTTTIWSSAAPFKVRLDWCWSVQKSANAGSWKFDDGTSDITDTVTAAATDNSIAYPSTIDDAYNEIDVGGSIRIVHGGPTFSCMVFALLTRIP